MVIAAHFDFNIHNYHRACSRSNISDMYSGSLLFESRSGHRLPSYDFSVVFLNHSRQMQEKYLKLDDIRFFPHHSKLFEAFFFNLLQIFFTFCFNVMFNIKYVSIIRQYIVKLIGSAVK